MSSRFNAHRERTDRDRVRAHDVLRRLVDGEHHAGVLSTDGVTGGVVANGFVIEEPAADRTRACKTAVSKISINLFHYLFIIIH